MVFIPTAKPEIGPIRIDLKDDWCVQDFEELCSSVRIAYEVIDRFLLLVETLNREAREEHPFEESPDVPDYIGLQTAWTSLYYGRAERYSDGKPVFPGHAASLDQILTAIAPYSRSLGIDKIRLESPGYLEFFGSLNPLKIISDSIRDYRSENTKRMQIDSHAALERDKLRVALAKEVMKKAPADIAGARVFEIVNSVVAPSAEKLEKIAANRKVVQVRMRPHSSNHRRLGPGEVDLS
jgi:hypothetical protein